MLHQRPYARSLLFFPSDPMKSFCRTVQPSPERLSASAEISISCVSSPLFLQYRLEQVSTSDKCRAQWWVQRKGKGTEKNVFDAKTDSKILYFSLEKRLDEDWTRLRWEETRDGARLSENRSCFTNTRLALLTFTSRTCYEGVKSFLGGALSMRNAQHPTTSQLWQHER
jgi:hypothetical protein